MTYREFIEGRFLRPIAGYPDYLISNKGEIYSKKAKRYLKNRSLSGKAIYISIDGKSKGLTIWWEVLKAFSDVDFTAKELYDISGNLKIKRGAYSWSGKKNPWRSVISYQNQKKTIGYFNTKEEAYKSYYEAFMKLRGFKPW